MAKTVAPLAASGAFEGEGAQLRVRQGLQAGLVERVEHAHQHGAGLHLRDFVAKRRAHLQHHVGTQGAGGIGDLGAGGHIGFVGHAGCHTGARLHTQGVALRLQLLDGLRGHGHAGFADSGFRGNADQHPSLLWWWLRPEIQTIV